MWRRPLLVVALVVAVLPLVVGAVRAGVDGWVPTGDNAIVATRAGDVFTANSPSLGMTTSLESFGIKANHPGPMLFWAFAVPYALTGQSPLGLLVAVVVIEAAAVVAVAAIAYRRGGPEWALLLLAGVVCIEWSLRGPTLGFPLNAVVIVLPFLAYLCLCWTLACGDAWALPAAIAVGSLCVQSYVGFGLVAVAAGVMGVVGFALRWRATSRVGTGRRALWWSLGLSVAVVAACWGPPLYQQFASSHGNLSALWRGFGPGSPVPASGGGGLWWRSLELSVGAPAVWQSSEPWRLAGSAPVTVAVLVLLVGGTAWAVWRKRSSLARLGVLACVLVAATAVTRQRSSAGFTLLQSLRFYWAVGPFVWAVALVLVINAARSELRAAHRGRALPTALRAKNLSVVFAAVVVLIGVAAAVAANPVGSGYDLAENRADQRAVRALTSDVVRSLGTSGTYGLQRVGTSAQLSLGPGLLTNLEHHGLSIRDADGDVAAYGSGRTDRGSTAGTLVIVDRDGQAKYQPPPEARLVADYDAGASATWEQQVLEVLAHTPTVTMTRAGASMLTSAIPGDQGGQQTISLGGATLPADQVVAIARKMLTDPQVIVGLPEPLRQAAVGVLLTFRQAIASPPALVTALDQAAPQWAAWQDATKIYLVPPS